MWAFFNRRGLVRQWKRKTKGITEAEIKRKFHLADANGDGRLNHKEFKKLLHSFGMEINDKDIDILMDRFDLDNDGDIDLKEFRLFIESEQKNLDEAEGTAGFKPTAILPAPKLHQPEKIVTRNSTDDWQVTSPNRRSRGASLRRRPSSAPRGGSSGSIANRASNNSDKVFLDEERVSMSGVDTKNKTMPVDHYSPADKRKPSNQHGTFPPARNQRRPASINPSLKQPETAEDVADSGGEDVDPLWLARMLKAQAEVEARVGKRYFN